jgi:hypothetical protein
MTELILGRNRRWIALWLATPIMAAAFRHPAAALGPPSSCEGISATGDSAYLGRYRQGATSVLVVESFGGRLAARPTFWGATQPLQRAVGDSFFVSDRPERRLTFQRDASGCVTSVAVKGNLELDGTFPRLADGERAPIELLLEGQGQAALTALRRSTTMGAAEFAQLGERILNDLRGDVRAGRAFLQAVVHAYPQSAKAWAVLGQLQIATADRAGAVASFRRAYALDSTNAGTRDALARLHALPAGVAMPAERLHLPFPLADVFRTPTDQERSAVERDWASRDLTPRNVTIVARERVQQGADRGGQGADTMTALIVSHDVRGFRHYGAIIIPDGATPGCCAVVLQVKSFDPEYAPLDIATEEPATAAILDRSLAKKVIYVLPSYRGESLTINGKAFTSQGDRRNPWDGATDDALALLEVAVRTVPEVDSSRVCVLGMSRGGTIALLAGERSRRIKCVVDISGPVDWFNLMPLSAPGWTTQEVVESALRSQHPDSTDGGWYLQWFLDSAIAGKWTLADVRHRMLASSPLYFAERLPPTQAHHGVQDEQVPVANGHALKAEFDRLGRKPPAHAVFFYSDGGHDTNVLISQPRIAAFLTEDLQLGTAATPKAAGGPTHSMADDTVHGRWQVSVDSAHQEIQLLTEEGEPRFGHGYQTSLTLAPSAFDGLSSADLTRAADHPVEFKLVRDAGTFAFDGRLGDGRGRGAFVFTPDGRFTSGLARRGYESPNAEQQFALALFNVSNALIDELQAEGYARPAVQDLVRVGIHCVDVDYMRGLARLGYRLGTVRPLMDLRIHNITPAYIEALAAAGYPSLTTDELMSASVHGVTADLVGDYRRAGYARLTLYDLISLQVHGVTPAFAARVRESSPGVPTVDELIDRREGRDRS